MSDLSQLSAFTADHSQHGPEWIVPGSRPQSLFCLACATETFEDIASEVPLVRKKHLLVELLNAINSHDQHLLDVLAEDGRVAWHLTQKVFGLLDISDNTISGMVVEVLVQLCCMLKSEELVCCLLHQISNQVRRACNYSSSQPALTLLGGLLHSIPALVQTLYQNEEVLIDFVLTGLTYPDEKVKSSCAFILAHCVASTAEGSRQVSLAHQSQLTGCLLPLLATAQSNELRINAMGLLKNLLGDEEPTRILMQYQGKTSLVSILKKMLLSRDDALQVTSVQCTAQVMLHQATQQGPCHYAEELLNGDVAEFLYETLATTNGLLLSSTFCCLLLFTEINSFFSKCHTVYGIESIIRAIQQAAKLNNAAALNYGLQLLSEIFKKQPLDTHLMNNESTLTQLSSLLTDCMKHPDVNVVIHTTKTLTNLLRRDHLPSPMNFQSLLTPLQALLDSLQRLPKPLAGTSHRKRTHHRHHGQGEGLSRHPSKQETLLSQGLGAIQKAFRLATDCLNDPSTTENHLTAPTNTQTTDDKTQNTGVSSLIQFLMQAVDTTCIPIVMVNFSDICLPDIYTHLFGMLCVALELDTSDSDRLSAKLASSSFIHLALTVRNRFPMQAEPLQDTVNSFLCNLCTSLQDLHPTSSSDDRQELIELLQQALPQIQGSAGEMLNLLYELASVSGGSSALMGLDQGKNLDGKQQAVLALLYFAFLHNDRLVPETTLSKALIAFLSNHPNLQQLPKPSLKHILFLFACCHGNGEEHSMHPGVQCLLKILQSEDLHSIYTHHPCILEWCFGSVNCNVQFARKILEQWLLSSVTDDDQEVTTRQCTERTTIPQLLRKTPQCCETLLDIMSSGSNPLISKSLSLLESVFCADPLSNDEDPSEMIMMVLRRRLPDVVQRLFLSETELPTDVHIVALLHLMCTVRIRRPQNELSAADVKLMYHVTNQLSKSPVSSQDVRQASLNYLTCLLIQTAPHGESRVAAILLSNIPTLKYLEMMLSTQPTPSIDLHCSCLSIIAHIIIYQTKLNIKVPHTMMLDLNAALEMLKSNKHLPRKVCALHLWTAIFNSKFESPVLMLVETSKPRTLLNDEDVGLGIKSKDVRMIYTLLQNTIAIGDPSLGQAAVTCLRSLVTYLMDKNQVLGHHVLSQPWNHQLMRCCIGSSIEDGRLPDYVFQLITMYLQQGNRGNAVSVQHLDSVADYLKSLDVIFSTDVVFEAISLIQQVMSQPHIKLSIKGAHGLHTFLQRVVDLTATNPTIRHLSGAIIQHPSTISTSTITTLEQARGLARDLLKQFTKYPEISQ
ncbi:meiosis inhibitor protein 1-like [Asterias rubens]|uniref:meiosis inhibitor protein 1-like n=1 Tax=Asterias rubens TaxID=7604 RepID=UPI0014551ACD|nr:meiosis inhibitor protein 1-like [Asterias rubens]